eukprot:364615-Chlamydomonas_euryale.AAC.41
MLVGSGGALQGGPHNQPVDLTTAGTLQASASNAKKPMSGSTRAFASTAAQQAGKALRCWQGTGPVFTQDLICAAAALQVSATGQCGARSTRSIAKGCQLTKQIKSLLSEIPQTSWLSLMRKAMRSTPLQLVNRFPCETVACMCCAIVTNVTIPGLAAYYALLVSQIPPRERRYTVLRRSRLGHGMARVRIPAKLRQRATYAYMRHRPIQVLTDLRGPEWRRSCVVWSTGHKE